MDLENDLDEVMHDRLLTLLGETSPVDYLQDSKHYHMVELIENSLIQIAEQYITIIILRV